MKPVVRINLKAVLGDVALVILGVGVALGLMELLLRTNPNLVPGGVRVNPPVRRVQAFKDETYEVKLSDGDLYYWMRGAIAPLPPDKDKVVAQVHFTTDAHGFRNSLPEKATYGIVALGDSFTVARNVAAPWPQKLAEYTGSDVLNLGEAGSGPQDELEILRQYGLKKRPQWVIMTYFEGNDLYDAASYEQTNPFLLTRFGRYILTRSTQMWNEQTASKAGPGVGTVGAISLQIGSNYRYPITVTIDDTKLEMAFFSYYITWLSAQREMIESSQNFRLVKETILQIKELSEAAGARFLLVYMPSKPHIYLPYLNDAETLERVFTDVPTLELDEAGFLQFVDQTATPELTRQHLDDQARLLADFAAEHNIAYLDLRPYFQEEAGTGAELYYPFDTHWNQHGHNLAAQTIAKYIEDMLAITASQKLSK
jgi:hypothetical protein